MIEGQKTKCQNCPTGYQGDLCSENVPDKGYGWVVTSVAVVAACVGCTVAVVFVTLLF